MSDPEESAFLLPESRAGVFGPLLVIVWPPPMALDVALLDHIEATDDELILSVNELSVSLYISDGIEAAKLIADRLAPYTRNSPIIQPDIYQDALRRLHSPHDNDCSMIIGDDRARVNDTSICIGSAAYAIDDIREQADRGVTLTLLNGGRVQAAALLLVVEAARRVGGPLGLDALSQRIAEFEARNTRRSPDPC